MKRIKFMQLSPRSATQDAYNDLPEHYIEGPEDAIARGRSQSTVKVLVFLLTVV